MSLKDHMTKLADFNAKLERRGITKSDLARKHKLKPHDVIRFLNGYGRGTRGKSHQIAMAIGFKV
jgi:gp16 family phage-associated protein